MKQIDDHLGRLFDEMGRMGRLDDTMIVFCSDHGDYMGDHWMGEKDWLHEEVVRTPMIVVDPRRAADGSRGSVSSELVEAIDLVPTFIESLGGDLTASKQWVEGESLQPTLHGTGRVSRDAAVSEADFGFLEMANHLPDSARGRGLRATMLRSDRFKYILSEVGPNLLYDLDEDPSELHDRIADPGLAAVRADMHEQLFEWFRHRKHDPSYPDSFIDRCSSPGGTAKRGIKIGYWDEAEVDAGIAGELY